MHRCSKTATVDGTQSVPKLVIQMKMRDSMVNIKDKKSYKIGPKNDIHGVM